MVLEPGEAVPEVTATTQDGERITVAFVEPAVLYFYPGEGTPGCAIEARQFDDCLEKYHEVGVEVYGVSTESSDTQREFADEYGVGFDLLSDPDGKVADAFGVPVKNGAARRVTFVCCQRQVCGLYEGVRPDGHARVVLRDVVEVGLVEP